MLKKKTLQIIIASIVSFVILAGGATGLYFVFRPDKEPPVTDPFEIIDYPLPNNLPDYALSIEWLGADGTAIDFYPLKPVMILFNGVSSYDTKENLTIPTDIYRYTAEIGDGGLSSISQNINRNLAFYWRKMGFNVGVFHYENFADDTVANINKKVYDSATMTYKDKNGVTVTSGIPSYTLTEAFVMQWLKLMKVSPLTGTHSPNQCMEIRFIGNGPGASLATAAADYLYNLYDRGHIDGRFVPSRVTLLNPYLNNKEENINITYREGQTVSSQLSYQSSVVPALSSKGVVFDMVESDLQYYLSYENEYTGLIKTETGVDEETQEPIYSYQVGTEGDCALYKTIKDSTAYLALRESFSTFFPESYRLLDRASRDWYLYSVNGTDDNSVGTSTIFGINETRPMLDDKNGGGSQSIVRYSVSAWTPTSYTRALKGRTFQIIRKTYDSTEGKYVPKDDIMTEFQAENNQISDLSGVYIMGYVYWRRDESNYINYGADTRLKNVEVRFIVNLDAGGSNQVTLKTVTGSDGFYSVFIDPAYYSLTINIEVILPSHLFIFGNTPTDTTEYTKLSMTSIKSTGNTAVTSVSSGFSQIMVRNCGLIKPEK